MLERAKAVTRHERWTGVEYARFADDLVILVNSHPRQQWLRQAVEKRLREELAKLLVEVNEEKSRKVDLQRGESVGFLGLSSVVSGVAGDGGCRCYCRKARNGRPCSASSKRFSGSFGPSPWGR